jgi:hypothetical protein
MSYPLPKKLIRYMHETHTRIFAATSNQQAKALAKKTGLPVSESIGRAIDEYLERLQRKADHLGAVTGQETPHG